MDLTLAGKTAVITGAARGIGAAIAETLAGEGCAVYLADVRLQEAAATARRIGAIARPLVMNVTDAAGVEQAVRTVLGERGRIDILVNNAGILSSGPVADATIEEWDAVFTVNLRGAFICTKAVLPAMIKAHYGKIINIASIAAMRGGGVFGNVIYGASKAGIVAMTQGLARELGPHGINVNAIAPAPLETGMTLPLLTGDSRKQLLARVPLGRLATLTEVAALAAFLASDVSASISGETIAVDGGLLKA